MTRNATISLLLVVLAASACGGTGTIGKRDDPLDMCTFYDQAGAQIPLEPGQTWIHFLLPTVVVTSTS